MNLPGILLAIGIGIVIVAQIHLSRLVASLAREIIAIADAVVELETRAGIVPTRPRARVLRAGRHHDLSRRLSCSDV